MRRLMRRRHFFFMQLTHLLVEVAEEVVGDLFRRRVDQARADLGELAADVGFRLVGKPGGLTLGSEAHTGAALGESRGAALALERDRKSTRLNSSHRAISYAVVC